MQPVATQAWGPRRSIITYGAFALMFLALGLSSLFNPFGTDQGEYATIAAAAQQGYHAKSDCRNAGGFWYRGGPNASRDRTRQSRVDVEIVYVHEESPVVVGELLGTAKVDRHATASG